MPHPSPIVPHELKAWPLATGRGDVCCHSLAPCWEQDHVLAGSFSVFAKTLLLVAVGCWQTSEREVAARGSTLKPGAARPMALPGAEVAAAVTGGSFPGICSCRMAFSWLRRRSLPKQIMPSNAGILQQTFLQFWGETLPAASGGGPVRLWGWGAPLEFPEHSPCSRALALGPTRALGLLGARGSAPSRVTSWWP